MAQLDRKSNPNSPAFDRHLQGDERVSSPFASPKCYDLEEAFPSQQSSKKSVLTKVKERARKLRHSLSSNSRKKHDNQGHGEVSTPRWGATLEDEDEDDEDEDPEYLGAPMYESELAPDSYKETARQHPRADPMFSERNASPQCIKHCQESEIENGKERSDSSNVAEISGATQPIDSKFLGLTIRNTRVQSSREQRVQSSREQRTGENSDHGLALFGQFAEGRKYELQQQGIITPTKWDKGVSVKEYFMNKLEPGEDEKALSKVISEAMSPRRAPGERGVVEKVKEVVSSFLRPQEPSSDSNPSSSSSFASTNPSLSRVRTSTSNTTSSPKASTGNSSPIIPVSTNADEVFDEKVQARIPQTN
nr:sialidase-like isoform X2 [Ipomoea batatas]